MKKKLKNYRQRGRWEAQQLFPIPKDQICELCGERPATQHHHKDGNTHNNTRENVKFACVECNLGEARLEGRSSYSRLTTDQIAMAKDKSLDAAKVAAELKIDKSYVYRLRRGYSPLPYDQREEGDAVPRGYKAPGKGRQPSLTYFQVRMIRGEPEPFKSKRCKEIAAAFGVSTDTVWRARKKKGVYAKAIYDKPVQLTLPLVGMPTVVRRGVVYETVARVPAVQEGISLHENQPN